MKRLRVLIVVGGLRACRIRGGRPYPSDRHAFSNADSRLDEYKWIYWLFEAPGQ